MTQMVRLDFRNERGFSDAETMSCFLPEIRLVSEIQHMDTAFTKTGKNYVFKLFLTHGIDVEFGFETEKEVCDTRRDLILAMMKYWGPDQMIFANGVDFEVTIVAAVSTITEMFAKERRFGFSVIIEGVPYPVNLIFLERGLAEQARQSISEKHDSYLECRSKKQQVYVAVN
jgi:hypothetical protein